MGQEALARVAQQYRDDGNDLTEQPHGEQLPTFLANFQPDLIAILDAESAEPLTAEMLAYGQRVRVIGYSAAPIMRRPECLKVFGPRQFGIDEMTIP